MVVVDDLTRMVELAKQVVLAYDEDDAIRVLDNLKVWISSSNDPSVYGLTRIALGFKGNRTPLTVDYDKKVKAELIDLYGGAAEKGEYVTKLLEAGLGAKRGYKILNRLACYTIPAQEEFDLLPYVEDSSWSDYWVEQIEFCAGYLNKHKMFGYDLMKVFTAKHSANTFYEVSYHLKDEEQYRISIDWLSDPYWDTHMAKMMVYTLMYKKSYTWLEEMIKPWMTEFIIDEIYDKSGASKEDHLAVIDKWINVSPLLEYAIQEYATNLNTKEYYELYGDLKDRYGFDGDDLAQSLQSLSNVPDIVMRRNEYYHENVNKYINGRPGAGSSAVSPFNAAALMGGE